MRREQKLKKQLAVIATICLLLFMITACGGSGRISGSDALDLVENHNAVIVDVRNTSEFDERHIVSAIHLPLNNITEENAVKMIGDFDTIVIVYCASGNRSRQARQTLLDIGFTRVYDLGGINNWAGNFA